jgi:metal-sulfur cluster biosynthetic enzyme
VIDTKVSAAAASAIPGGGPLDRRVLVLNAIDSIADPCSQALGRPVGLVAMGLIARLDVAGACVSITVLPTFPTCMFRGVFEEEIAAQVRSISWCKTVSVCFAAAEIIWDEQRMSDAARRTLKRSEPPRRVRDTT